MADYLYRSQELRFNVSFVLEFYKSQSCWRCQIKSRPMAPSMSLKEYNWVQKHHHGSCQINCSPINWHLVWSKHASRHKRFYKIPLCLRSDTLAFIFIKGCTFYDIAWLVYLLYDPNRCRDLKTSVVWNRIVSINFIKRLNVCD